MVPIEAKSVPNLKWVRSHQSGNWSRGRQNHSESESLLQAELAKIRKQREKKNSSATQTVEVLDSTAVVSEANDRDLTGVSQAQPRLSQSRPISISAQNDKTSQVLMSFDALISDHKASLHRARSAESLLTLSASPRHDNNPEAAKSSQLQASPLPSSLSLSAISPATRKVMDTICALDAGILDVKLENGQWLCQMCTFVNQHEMKACSICDSAAPSPAVARDPFPRMTHSHSTPGGSAMVALSPLTSLNGHSLSHFASSSPLPTSSRNSSSEQPTFSPRVTRSQRLRRRDRDRDSKDNEDFEQPCAKRRRVNQTEAKQQRKTKSKGGRGTHMTSRTRGKQEARLREPENEDKENQGQSLSFSETGSDLWSRLSTRFAT